MEILITGGEGFMGYHICKELLKTGSTVITYDALKHYIPLNKSYWTYYQQYRVDDLKDRIIRIRGDTTDRGLLEKTLREHKPDIILHLAALPIADVSNRFPEEAKRNIIDGTITLMDVLKDRDFERVVYTSSSMVYGNFMRDRNDNVIPAREDQVCDPIGLYGAMKLCGEYITRAYAKRFAFDHTIIRPSAVYGPTDCNMRVTEIFLERALKGEKLRLDNGGLSQLDFSYVKDVAKGFILASESKRAKGETFNITRGEGRTIKELAEVIANLIPDTEVYTKEVEVYRPSRGALDISKAKRLLGYRPQYSLEKGMKEYVNFVQKMGVIK